MSERPQFAKPQILASPLERIVLHLLNAGIDIDTFKFFHPPTPQQIEAACETLRSLECLEGTRNVTSVGRIVGRLPLSPRYGRMIVEAQRRGVEGDVVILAAIMEQGGIINHNRADTDKFSTTETASDALIELEAFKLAQETPENEREELGIGVGRYRRAHELYDRLLFALSTYSRPPGSTGDKEQILASLRAGMKDCLYKRSLTNEGYKDARGNYRDLPKGSVVGDAQYILGIPWNLQTETRLGPRTRRLITMATRVTAA
jgi:HrpA-like RNA helicase